MTREQVLAEQFKDPEVIRGFFGDYRFLSNFHLCQVTFAFDSYPSSENAFQAAKFDGRDRRKFFEPCTPSEAKKLGSPGSGLVMLWTPEQWDEKRAFFMNAILKDKFTRHEDLKQLLLETGDKYLEETNWWDDRFWGVCDGEGKNMLGDILMKIRTKLKSQ